MTRTRGRRPSDRSHALPDERLPRVEGRHEGAAFRQESQGCESYTKLHRLFWVLTDALPLYVVLSGGNVG